MSTTTFKSDKNGIEYVNQNDNVGAPQLNDTVQTLIGKGWTYAQIVGALKKEFPEAFEQTQVLNSLQVAS